ncbi:MAG: hypothetical protein HC790_02965 [Acaryochloridaceae cyanobacterium CSU_3_4]|nr:hypothetical protein [Acaryochloridaceae cyanobacterium CSU_3_4]
MITESSDYGEVRNVSLIPNQSISQEQALSFSRILDDSGEIDFEKSKQLDPDTVSYLGCLGDDDITSARVENFLGCYVRLHLTPDGNVSKIELIHSSD